MKVSCRMIKGWQKMNFPAILFNYHPKTLIMIQICFMRDKNIMTQDTLNLKNQGILSNWSQTLNTQVHIIVILISIMKAKNTLIEECSNMKIQVTISNLMTKIWFNLYQELLWDQLSETETWVLQNIQSNGIQETGESTKMVKRWVTSCTDKALHNQNSQNLFQELLLDQQLV